MKLYNFLLLLFFIGSMNLFSQVNTQALEEEVFQPSNKKVIDITHTRLELKPFIEKRSLYGKAFLNIKAYNKPIDEIQLDAKGMKIRQVYIVNASGFIPVEHQYDDLVLTIQLNRIYKLEEQFTVFIEYTAHPYELEEKGILPESGRGLYFIDPFEKNPYKDTQLWTSGQTNSNSVWFPTVDAPNESFTQEIYITVDDKYTTLSNGILENTVYNNDGTKTDYWKQDLPHAPYLAMIAVSKFYVTIDDWGPIKVSYYTNKNYHEDVRKIFGQTPYMMSYYSNLFGVDFPWEKYASAVVEDFNSGAMENTTASLFYGLYFADRYDNLDRNYDDVIAHEIAHQWFGNTVTCESWAHLGLNEAFATYSEFLWYENKYGADEAAEIHNDYMNTYLHSTEDEIDPIIKHYYRDANDLFDAHRYEKGSRVLHMLRDYLGDELFFEGVQHYIKLYRHRTVEVSDLRQAFEKVSGEDLYWFFDQWFLKPGHPIVEIKTKYDESRSTVTVDIHQVQNFGNNRPYILPLSIDIYEADKNTRKEVTVDKFNSSFTFKVNSEPKLVNVDAKKIMLWVKTEDKLIKQFAYQFFNAPLFMDKLEALENLLAHQDKNDAKKVFMAALNDDYKGIREFAINNIQLKKYTSNELALKKVQEMIISDPSSRVRKNGITNLSKHDFTLAKPLCDSLLNNDSSRLVIGSALGILYPENPVEYTKKAEKFEDINNYYIYRQLTKIYSKTGDNTKNDYFKKAIWSSIYTSRLIDAYIGYLQRMDTETVDDAAKFLSDIVQFEEDEATKSAAKSALEELKEYFINSKVDENDKKLNAIKSALMSLN